MAAAVVAAAVGLPSGRAVPAALARLT